MNETSLTVKLHDPTLEMPTVLYWRRGELKSIHVVVKGDTQAEKGFMTSLQAVLHNKLISEPFAEMNNTG